MPETAPIKLSLASGDTLLIRDRTQSTWLHGMPKRKGGDADNGRIKVTLQKTVLPYGTEHYYQCNVGNGDMCRWSKEKKEAVPVDSTFDMPLHCYLSIL
jgi:hypothetical protein